MNYHPLLVHFPIAFLSIYSLLELIRFKKTLNQPYWFYIKGALLFLGSGASILTYFAGKAIEPWFASPVVELHSHFAVATIATYGLLALSYFVMWIEKDFQMVVKSWGWWKKIVGLNKTIFRTPVVILLAIAGLVLITITGALGGIIAFGPDTDPMTQIVNHLFFGGSK